VGSKLVPVAPGADRADPAGKCEAPEAQVVRVVSKAVPAAALEEDLPVALLASNTVKPCGRTILSVMCCGQDFALAR
jgi:hypothetical protein